MLKKILLCTDLSENSKQAFPIAKDIATKYDASIDLLAVVTDIAETALFSILEQPNLISEDVHKKILEEVEKDLNNIALKFDYKKLKPVVLEAKGAVHTEIVNYAQQNNVDMIVMSSSGRTGLKRFVVGGVSEKVLREIKVPILFVPCK
ncbi:MAG: universal stress protein [Bdellovibrionota bacterium]